MTMYNLPLLIKKQTSFIKTAPLWKKKSKNNNLIQDLY